jgi:hypothetical protein
VQGDNSVYGSSLAISDYLMLGPFAISFNDDGMPRAPGSLRRKHLLPHVSSSEQDLVVRLKDDAVHSVERPPRRIRT